MNLLEVQHLSVFDGEQILLDDMNISVPENRIVAILGETGSGKTLFAKSVSGILSRKLKSTGKILYHGEQGTVELNGLTPKERNEYRGREILWIPQNSADALNPLIRMEEQLLLPMRKRRNLSTKEAKREISELFEMLDLTPREKILRAYPHELSGGMKVRAMIAIGLAMKSRLLILDEPTKGLDSDRCERLMHLIRETVDRFHRTVILISHDFETVSRYAEHTAVMHRGRVLDSGRTEEVLFTKPHKYVEALRKALPVNGMEVTEGEY